MRPRLPDLLNEVRVLGELATFAADMFLIRHSAERPARKAVLLIPGLMAGDPTLYPLALRLWMAGYPVFFAGIWCNADCPVKAMERLEKALRKANRRTNSRVVVIGHSLGGIYARELARRHPHLVERTILLGAPLKHPIENLNQPIRAIAEMAEMVHKGCLSSIGQPCPLCGIDLPGTPPPVPETIIYTKSDGVLNWRSCLERGPNVEAVEVRSSHCGLPVSLETWEVIIDRLESAPGGDGIRADNHDRNSGRHRLFRFRPSHLRLVKRPASAA